MRIRFTQEGLASLLGRAQSVVERKTTRPILENALLEALDGKLRISVTDLRTTLTQVTACTVETPGAISVAARKLYEIVRELPKADVVIEVRENQWVTVSSGKSVFHLPGIAPEEYPTLPDAPQSFFSFPADVFSSMIEKTIFAVSSDESRIYLTGVLVQEVVGDDGTPLLRMVATDGHRLSLVERPVGPHTACFGEGVIVPKKGVAELKALIDTLDSESARFELTAASGRVYARVGGSLLAVTLIDASYPNYEQVIPRDVKTWLACDRVSLTDALRRVSLLSDDETRSVILEASERGLSLSSDNPRFGDAREEVELTYRGEPLRVAFNAQYFLEALKVVDGPEVRIGISEVLSPCLIKSGEDARFLSVIMPMRIE
ncbi:MAG: DNA polymerase III subunit beta [Deltaproteobacteria bacterium]|nr:DNA polymerase III subunit beta [Deltaproteobacteria bacterium]